MKKKTRPEIVVRLEKAMSKAAMHPETVARIIECDPRTVDRWLKGWQCPNKNMEKRIHSAIDEIDRLARPADERHKEALLRLGQTGETWARKRGRKPLFRPIIIEEAKKLAGFGMTQEEMAAFWGVSHRTLERWLKRYPEFCLAVKEGKLKADNAVEESLYRRARGYEYTERYYDIEYEEDPQTGQVTARRILKREITKQFAPDTTAQIYWLQNRRPDKWRTKHELGFVAPPDGDGTVLRIEVVPAEPKPKRAAAKDSSA